jgi:TetR/AcrR family transcriptional repressor of bet genes
LNFPNCRFEEQIMPVMPKNPNRTRVSRDIRRRQLIEATIETIAKRGLSDTTLAHVSKTAGLSQGIVNLHFTSKENLLNETLKFVRDDYEAAWRSAFDQSATAPAEQLAAVLRADYKAAVADVKKLAVWFAFWGEVKSRPAYRKICQARVLDQIEILEDIIGRLIVEGDYPGLDAPLLTTSIMAMADGLWLNILVSARNLKRRDVEQIMMRFLAQIFHKHTDTFVQR